MSPAIFVTGYLLGMPDTIPVFLNGRRHETAPGTPLIDLVRTIDPPLADAVMSGAALVVDGRGVAVPADGILSAGMIFRVFRSARSHDADGD